VKGKEQNQKFDLDDKEIGNHCNGTEILEFAEWISHFWACASPARRNQFLDIDICKNHLVGTLLL
jgi:hypothetical protein